MISAVEAKKARLALGADIRHRDRQLINLEQILATNNAKLAKAQAAQTEVIRKTRELDDAKREVELSVGIRVRDSLDAVRAEAKIEAEDYLKSRVTEKELQISGMQRQIEELKRRSEQGSQQLQGEALEVNLEALLKQRFPADAITPVPIGASGGDILQQVINPAGASCGVLIWEFKHTKRWNDRWLSKLREDQRKANAANALLVSTSVPNEVASFDFVEGVWVAKPLYAVPLATALRLSLIEIAGNQTAAEGQRTKIEQTYQYLTGQRFRQRMEAIIERFTEMRGDLDRERSTTARLWAKREEQLRSVLESSAGLYGDLQGIAGRAMPEIDSLRPLMIAEDS